VDDKELKRGIREAVGNLGTGKALSIDLIPDDCFEKEKLIEMEIADRKVIFNGPRIQNSLTA